MVESAGWVNPECSSKDLECTNEELFNKLGLIVDGKLKRAAVREAVYNALIHCKREDGIPIQV